MKLNEIHDIIDNVLPVGENTLKVTGFYDKMFGSFYEPFTEYFLRKLDTALDEIGAGGYLVDREAFMLNSAGYFLTDQASLALSTLIIEINERKESGVYDSDDIYSNFYEDMRSAETIKALAAKYPCLYDIIFHNADERVQLITDCLRGMIEHKDEIMETFGFDCTQTGDLSISSGDSHNGGKKVVIVKGPSGTLVYKPHALAPELLFEKVRDIVMEKGKVKYSLDTAKVLSCGDYGFQEFIRQKPVSTEEEACRYYYRIGAFSAVFNALRCDDLHYENIVCAGERPYFVDLETLVKNNSKESDTKNYPPFLRDVLSTFEDSVLGTMMYPMNSSFVFFDFDMGGISGSPKQTSKKWKSYSLCNEGTDRICITSGEGRLSEANNLLYCNGKEVLPIYFAEEMIQGYQDAMNAVIASKAQIIDAMKSSEGTIRRVLRPTAMYGKFLQVASSPLYYRDKTARVKLFSKLYKGIDRSPREFSRVSCEVEALMNNDIPFFEQKLNGKDIIANHNYTISDYNTSSPSDGVEQFIGKIDEDYIRRQTMLIRMSLASSYNSKAEGEVFGRELPREKFALDSDMTRAAEMIGEQLLSSALQAKESDSISWFTESLIDNIKLDVLDVKMYDGGGTVMLFLYLWKYTGREKWLRAAENVMSGAEELGYTKPKADVSFFTGAAGLVYLWYNFFALTGDTSYVDKIDSYLKECLVKLKESPDDIRDDIIAGAAGTLVALSRMNRQLRLDVIDEILEISAEHLAERFEKGETEVMTGFAHGYAGIALAFAEYGDYTGDERYTALASKAVDMENKYFCEEEKNWKDLRDKGGFGSFWCHGAPGIGLARLMMKKLKGFENNETISEDILRGIHILLREGFASNMDHSLCHGTFGTMDMLLTYANAIGSSELRETAVSAAGRYMNEIEKEGFKAGIKGMSATPSGMTGITGVAYTLMRLAHPEMPALNSIEIPEIRRTDSGTAEHTDSEIYAFAVS
ncbi:MAG: Lanthionine synthetase C-like protein [Firmicutes bacterium ADurb.BinA205]|nr:MAG: Lanthionine synthetase C-like protein [Firmicutes bacterium ADurb.BinA205]